MDFDGTVEGKDGGEFGLRRLHETTTDSGTGKGSPHMVLTTLAHHMDMAWLREAFERTRRDGATGVDGQTGADYAANLEEHLHSAAGTSQVWSVQAPPVRRVHIPKGTGHETRPLGIPTFEDKVLQ